jgi:hypothetical protein
MTTIGRWSPNKVRNKIIDAQWVSETRYALELVKPSSVVVTGTGSETATISSLGSVDFAAVDTMYVNGVFSSGYDNYMLVCRHHKDTSGTAAFYVRVAASGAEDNGSNYTVQELYATSTTVGGFRTSSGNKARIGDSSNTARNGDVTYIYGPYLAQPTAFRSVEVAGSNSAFTYDIASTHNQSTSYDGIRLFISSGTFSGRVAVYGMRG